MPETLLHRVGHVSCPYRCNSLKAGWQQILYFTAGNTIDQNLVTVQTTGHYYLNTGVLPFFSQDVIYDLQGGRLRLQPRQKS